ncbi:sterol regulatory element-binding protein cleavage-activating protein isoform X2 [Coccinella septempunctata]|uniref:sterol regulatory element-binding protein cleavage-activating protein isoform X2 n=1 Tax=Coccinella septempunctata TaxID=41139 RepID=UPI001D071D4F|nr:sterol regulatory element-binding protein cleavage-activating protein isoform X2 [Coccinella septempunctata]
MSSRDEYPQRRGISSRSTVPEKVAQFFYSYGLLASSWPFCILSIAVAIFLICCYPLLNLPLPGNTPIQIQGKNVTENIPYKPFCYVQQLVLRVAVMPWESHLTLGDAFRAPLYESFKLLDAVRNYEEIESSRSLAHVCLHVEAIKRIKAVYQDILPQYSCLVLSPANIWHQDVEQFAKDDSLLSTIFRHQNFQRGKTSIAEIAFGMHMVDTGIKRYPFRNRQRIIQFAVTLFLKEYDKVFIEGLRQKLVKQYPLHQNESNMLDNNSEENTIVIRYPGEITYWEFVPITIAFILLFLYYYFSLKKIEAIKSKLAMSITVVITVLGSMIMTLGICFFFGRTLSLKGKEIFPYLAILVGIENVLVLTKSIASTPSHLDFKIRIAQGLSKEGWGITKNLLLELTILTFGLSTFVHSIQEFCLFAITSLVTDFFLNMTFFMVILAIDIRRMEDMNKKFNTHFRSSLLQNHVFYDSYTPKKNSLNRSKSHPRLSTYPTNVVAGQAHNAQEKKKIPKRLRLVNIWARTRLFQRSFMILMATWILIIAYNSGIVEHYILNYTMKFSDTKMSEIDNSTSSFSDYKSLKMFPHLDINKSYVALNYVTHNPLNIDSQNHSADLCKLKHPDYEPRTKLSPFYWSSILGKYNISLSRQYITILPTIKLSHVITPEDAIVMRNPYEKYGETFQWQALAAALDPMEFDGPSGKSAQTDQPLFPSSPMEMFLTTLLCIVSTVVLTYTFVVLYRCICSRNYAEWRASWFNNEKGEESENESQVLLEAITTALEGHQQSVELLVSDGNIIVSCCLEGTIKVWDNNRGELVSNIDRYSYFRVEPKLHYNYEPEEQAFSDYESGSPPSRDESLSMYPRLLHKINTNFSNIKSDSPPSTSARYNFDDSYQLLYNSNSVGPTIRNRLKDINWLKDIVRKENRKSASLDSDNHSASGSSECVLMLDSNESCNFESKKFSPVWCLDYLDNMIVIGCADGHMEFWDASTAKLKCIYNEDVDGVGITHIKLIGSRVVAARLYGNLDFFALQSYNQGRPVDWNFTVAYRRTHIRTGSHGSMPDHSKTEQSAQDELRCVKLVTVRAHQQPISCMECEGGSVITGSLDHTLKLSKLEDGRPVYTLHGHCGPITCMFIDALKPSLSGSGSQDGMLCIWDLSTGTCLYNIQAHNGCITSLTYSPSYVISLATDDKMCVWERFQGHLLTTIQISQTFSSPLTMLAPHLVVTARTDSLAIWDCRSGQCVRTIQLGRSPYINIKQLILLRDAVLCDYGNQLRVVRFPLITHKFD